MKKGKSTSARTILMLAVTFLVAVYSHLPAQGQPATDTSIANFQADVTNPATPLAGIKGWSQAEEQRAADLLTEDFTHASSVELLKESPQTEKPSSLPVIRAGYGQFFSANNLLSAVSNARIKSPSWLCLKVSFSF